MGGTGVGRFQKIERSKELATERATEKRKEEGRALFEYEQLLKTMGMKASKEFEKRKAAYAAKLQGEKDHKFKRQATKRKRREAEEAAKAGEEEEESGEEGAEGSKAKKARVDTSNPFFKEQSAFEEKQKAKEEEKRKQEEEVLSAPTTHPSFHPPPPNTVIPLNFLPPPLTSPPPHPLLRRLFHVNVVIVSLAPSQNTESRKGEGH